jgi:glycosyltransferase involved in cell wall biosynthesis
MKQDKIFVQIASYRDPQLLPTINDALIKADNPNNLVFGICWQYDETENPDIYNGNDQFRVDKYHYSESQGLGWARNKTNQLLRDEKYTLQLDSHHRFAQGWDTMMIEDYEQALTFSEKPILTTYLTPFSITEDSSCGCKSVGELNPTPCLMSQYEFSSDRLLMSMPYFIGDFKDRDTVIKARTLSGHFYFTVSDFIKEIPYDPDIYFGGYCEETTMSIRAWTAGYDFFSPYRQYIWHEYTRQGRPKHWEDHGIESQTQKTSGERDAFARKKTRQIFEQEDNGIDLGTYGLNNVRTLRDYEIFGGFDFKNCRIQDYTLSAKEPANPTPWEDQFISKEYNIVCEWDLDFFKDFNAKKPKFLTLGLLSKSGIEIFRKDFTIENEPQYVNLENNKYTIKGKAIEKPSTLVMYLYDEDQTWSNRYEKSI